MRNSIADFSFTAARMGLNACKTGEIYLQHVECREYSLCNIHLPIRYLGTERLNKHKLTTMSIWPMKA